MSETNGTEVKPLKPTELQELVTDLEKRIEHLQEWNGKTYQKLTRLREAMAFMVIKYQVSDEMYDSLYEKASDVVYACDEHQAENLKELEGYIS